MSGVQVWDRPVRLLHALLAVGMLGCWATGWAWTWALLPDGMGPSSTRLAEAHVLLGYGVGAVVLARLAWGRWGGHYARFAQFVRSPAHTWRYAQQVWRRAEPRHLGHNPLGGWMVLALLGCAAAAVLSGALYTSDWLWGYNWLFQLHRALAWAMLALVLLHLGGVCITSRRHNEPLAAAMWWHGRKRR